MDNDHSNVYNILSLSQGAAWKKASVALSGRSSSMILLWPVRHEQNVASKNKSSYFFVAKMWHTENALSVGRATQTFYTINNSYTSLDYDSKFSRVKCSLKLYILVRLCITGYFRPYTNYLLVIILINKTKS